MALHIFESNLPGAPYRGYFGSKYEGRDPADLTGIPAAFGVVAPADDVPPGTPFEAVTWDGTAIQVDGTAGQRDNAEAALRREPPTAMLVLLMFLWRIVNKQANGTALNTGELQGLENIETLLPSNAQLAQLLGGGDATAAIGRIRTILEGL